MRPATKPIYVPLGGVHGLQSRRCDSHLREQKKIDPEDIYSISCFPAFGINYYYVGGDISAAGKVSFPNDVVRNQSKAAGILAFATAGYGALNDKGVSAAIAILTPPMALQLSLGQQRVG